MVRFRGHGSFCHSRQLYLFISPFQHGDRSSVWLEHLVVVQRVVGSSPIDRPIRLRQPRLTTPGLPHGSLNP